MRSLPLLIAVLALPACSVLPERNKDESRSLYLIAPVLSAPVARVRCGSIQVSPGSGASGFRSSRMAYMRAPFKLEYFAFSAWAGNPARMLGEAVREYFHTSGGFEAVVGTPAANATDLRVDLSDGKVLQRFSGDGSQIELTMEARVYASARPQQVLSQRFALIETAAPDPVDGVRAANVAAGRFVTELFLFVQASCADIGAPVDNAGPEQ